MSPARLRSWHRQAGLWASLWLVLAGLTTLIINHREWILPPPGQSSGPYGQYLLSHAICASQPDLVLVGTAAGLYVSRDGGKTFTSITLPVPARQVVAVDFHPNEPSHFYAVLREDGIYSSLDSGKLWTRIAFPSSSPIQSFHVGFDGTISVLTREGLHRRVQESWSLAPRPPEARPAAGRDWVRLAYSVHDGQIWGKAGVLITDLVALSLIFLAGTGWWIWIWERSNRRR